MSAASVKSKKLTKTVCTHAHSSFEKYSVNYYSDYLTSCFIFLQSMDKYGALMLSS